ncbi:MAG: F0F1 ATP synthase subunit B [bacterium]
MDSIIDTFHVDLKLLIAQAVNFAIVFLALYYLAFKPLAKTMQNRSQKIADGLKNAEVIAKKLEQSKEEQKAIIKQAKQDANQLLQQAQNDALERKDQMINKAKEEIGQIITTEKAKIQQEKAAILKELKAEVADLVVLTTTQLLQEKIDTKKDKDIINQLIK